jgi:hypothetical protein
MAEATGTVIAWYVMLEFFPTSSMVGEFEGPKEV